MMRIRIVFVTVSVMVVTLFTSLFLIARETREELFRALGNLAEVVHLVRSQYVNELDSEVLSLSLEAGIVESVDPHAAVLPREAVAGFREMVARPPAYGLVLGIRLGSAGVRAVLPGSPAESAGVERWEILEKVDGVYTRGRPLWQVRMVLAEHEQAGEAALLTVLDRLLDQRREVTLSPGDWTLREFEVEPREEAQVIRLRELAGGAAGRLAEVLRAHEGALILDLRPLAWGREEEAIAVADLFVATGELGSWRGRQAGAKRFDASPEVAAARLPTVLVDGATEGVAEVLAGALQRAGATLVGQATAGNAAHMQLVDDGDITLWLPVGRWLRADGEPLYGQGLAPDVVVEEPGSERGDGDQDPVLERALELVEGDALDVAA